MKRYGIFPIIGAGQTTQDPFRSAVDDLGGANGSTNGASIIPTHTSGPDIGQPLFNFCISIFSTVDLPAVMAISNSFVFPDYPLDAEMSGMEAATRTGMVQSVQAYNLDGAGFHLDATHLDTDSYRMVLNDIIAQIDPGHPGVNALNCGEKAA